MKIAYTGWTWLIHHEDQYRYEFEQSLKEISDLGYDAVENFAFITRYFDDDATAVKTLLDRYHLEMVNLYEHFTDDAQADYESAEHYVEFMKQIGATHLNLQGVMWEKAPLNRPTDKEKIQSYAALSNRIGALCQKNGIKACFHPHACTPVFTQEQIDLFLSQTDPDLVWLCLDTAHTLLAGMDVPAAFDKYLPRIGYVHLKDVDPDESLHPEWPMLRFLPLGYGCVDFSGMLKMCRKHHYDGVLCVELDNPPVCNYKAAMDSRNYIHNVLHL